MMVVGKAPFFEANESETLTMILDCKFHIPDHVSPACQRLVEIVNRDLKIAVCSKQLTSRASFVIKSKSGTVERSSYTIY